MTGGPDPTTETLLTLTEAARALSVTPKHIGQMIRAGVVQRYQTTSHRQGSQTVFVTRSDVLRVLALRDGRARVPRWARAAHE